MVPLPQNRFPGKKKWPEANTADAMNSKRVGKKGSEKKGFGTNSFGKGMASAMPLAANKMRALAPEGLGCRLEEY